MPLCCEPATKNLLSPLHQCSCRQVYHCTCQELMREQIPSQNYRRSILYFNQDLAFLWLISRLCQCRAGIQKNAPIVQSLALLVPPSFTSYIISLLSIALSQSQIHTVFILVCLFYLPQSPVPIGSPSYSRAITPANPFHSSPTPTIAPCRFLVF